MPYYFAFHLTRIIGRKGLERHIGEPISLEGIRKGILSSSVKSSGIERRSGTLDYDEQSTKFGVRMLFDSNGLFAIKEGDVVSLYLKARGRVNRCMREYVINKNLYR